MMTDADMPGQHVLSIIMYWRQKRRPYCPRC